MQRDHNVASRRTALTEAFGIYPGTDFDIVRGTRAREAILRQARWYFRDEIVAVPRAGLPVASFTRGLDAFGDVRRWASERGLNAPIDYPPLVWIAAPHVLRAVRITDDGQSIVADGERLGLRTVDKIPLNRSYYDASSIAYLREHPLTVRGTREGDTFMMRTVWPDDFALGPTPPPLRSLPDAATPALALRAMMREAPLGGARSPYTAHTLWQRDPSMTHWNGKPILAFMANGAQGDDDEAHAGHFALVTGRIANDGRIGDWLADNFYTLDFESEKGIIAAPVTLDNYLGDLNSGQGWYRPSYLIVLVLRDARVPALVQSAINRVYNQFYRHRLVYYHPSANCTSISVDTLRALGWPVASRGASNRLLAWLSFPYVALKERSFAKAKLTFDYLTTDQTRLLPAAAFEECFAGALASAHGAAADGELARLLAQDIEAIAYLRVPQFPSSRAFGDAPAVTTKEYRSRVPRDPALRKIVPVPPRPFPDELRDPDL